MSAVSPAVAWLERGYDKPGAFQQRSGPWLPRGLFQLKPDHATPCRCEAPRQENWWTHRGVAAKWKVAEEIKEARRLPNGAYGRSLKVAEQIARGER